MLLACSSMVLLLALTVPAAASPASSAANRCENVKGTFLGQAVPWADGTGFDVLNMGLTGPLVGHPLGEQTNFVAITKVLPNGGIHFVGEHDFHTDAFGQMTTHDKGHITANGSGHNVMTLFGDHSGQIIIKGDVDLVTDVIDVTYHGRVCTR